MKPIGIDLHMVVLGRGIAHNRKMNILFLIHFPGRTETFKSVLSVNFCLREHTYGFKANRQGLNGTNLDCAWLLTDEGFSR